MRLFDYQRSLSRLVLNGAGAVLDEENAYLRSVRDSSGLHVVREIVRWWRGFSVERTCPLTARMLHQVGRFDRRIEDFCQTRTFSAYIEELAKQFLSFIQECEEPLAVSVAAFEQALLEIGRGHADERVVYWPRNPKPVLNALLDGRLVPNDADAGSFVTYLSGNEQVGIELRVTDTTQNTSERLV